MRDGESVSACIWRHKLQHAITATMPTTRSTARQISGEQSVQAGRPSDTIRTGRQSSALRSPRQAPATVSDQVDSDYEPSSGPDDDESITHNILPYHTTSKAATVDSIAAMHEQQPLRQRNAVEAAREQTKLLKAKHKLPASPPPQQPPRRVEPAPHAVNHNSKRSRWPYLLLLLLPLLPYFLVQHPEVLPTQLVRHSYFKQSHQMLQRLLSPLGWQTVDYQRVRQDLQSGQLVTEWCNKTPELCYSVATKLQPALLHRFDTSHKPHTGKLAASDTHHSLHNPLVILLVGPQSDGSSPISQFAESLSHKLFNSNARHLDIDLAADPTTDSGHAANAKLTSELQHHFAVHDEGVVLLEHLEHYKRYHAEQLQLYLDDSGDAPYKHAIYLLSLQLPANELASLQLDDKSNKQLLEHADLGHIASPVKAYTDKQYQQRVAAVRQYLRTIWKSAGGSVDDTLEPLLVRIVKNVLIVT